MDTFDTDEMARGVFDMFSVNPKFIRAQKEIDQIRKDRADAEKRKQEAENLRATGQGADSLARAAATADEAGMLSEGGFGTLQ